MELINVPISDEDYFDSLLKKPSVFKNPQYLSVNYIPHELPHREEEFRSLARIFRHVFEENNEPMSKVILSGSTGSGKTTLAKRFGSVLENIGKEKKFMKIYINCRIYKSPYLIINTIARKINDAIPSRGYSFEELQSLLVEILDYYKPKILLILDEVDYLISRSGTDILYALLRISEMTTRQFLSYIFIAKSLDFLEALDDSTLSSFNTNHIALDRYSENNLIDILRTRVKLAFYNGIVTNDAVKLIADIASKSGDARYAIELLWGAGNCADDKGSPIVYPDHVRKAKSLIHPELSREVIVALSLHQKLVLLAIIRKLKYTKNAYVSTSDAISAYQIACEEYQQEPRKHTQLWSYLQELSKQSVIETRLSGEGLRGKTTLISLPDVSVETIEAYLVKQIELKQDGDKNLKKIDKGGN